MPQKRCKPTTQTLPHLLLLCGRVALIPRILGAIKHNCTIHKQPAAALTCTALLDLYVHLTHLAGKPDLCLQATVSLAMRPQWKVVCILAAPPTPAVFRYGELTEEIGRESLSHQMRAQAR